MSNGRLLQPFYWTDPFSRNRRIQLVSLGERLHAVYFITAARRTHHDQPWPVLGLTLTCS